MGYLKINKRNMQATPTDAEPLPVEEYEGDNHAQTATAPVAKKSDGNPGQAMAQAQSQIFDANGRIISQPISRFQTPAPQAQSQAQPQATATQPQAQQNDGGTMANAYTVSEDQVKSMIGGNNDAATQQQGTPVQQASSTAQQVSGNATATGAQALNIPSIYNPDGTLKTMAQRQQELNEWYANQFKGRQAPTFQAPETPKRASYEEIFNEYINPELTKNEADAQKRARANALMAAIGDGISGLANIAGTMRGAKALKYDTASLSAAAQKRFDDLLAKQEADRKKAFEMKYKLRELQGKEDEAAYEKARKQYEDAVSRYDKDNERIDKLREAFDKQGADAQAQANKDYEYGEDKRRNNRDFDERVREFDIDAEIRKREAENGRINARANQQNAHTNSVKETYDTIETGSDEIDPMTGKTKSYTKKTEHVPRKQPKKRTLVPKDRRGGKK